MYTYTFSILVAFLKNCCKSIRWALCNCIYQHNCLELNLTLNNSCLQEKNDIFIVEVTVLLVKCYICVALLYVLVCILVVALFALAISQ